MVRLRRIAERISLSLRRGEAADEPRLPLRRSARAAPPGVSRNVPAEQMAGGSAQLQQHGADPSEPLSAWVGTLPSVAPDLPLRVRAGPSGRLSGRHDAVLGLDDVAVRAESS